MPEFRESDHPRGTKSRFVNKPQSAPELSLAPSAPPALPAVAVPSAGSAVRAASVSSMVPNLPPALSPSGSLRAPRGLIPMLAGTVTPNVSLSGLTHVGSLDASRKGALSYEGAGLSVSQHPDVWGRIARLGGPVWDVADAVMLDYHELSVEQREAIAAWGVDRGYASLQTTCTVTFWDDEYEERRTSEFTTRAEAEAEFDDEFIDPDNLSFEDTKSLVATDAFPDSTVKAGALGIEQVLATVWVEEVATSLDGVWWEDDLDVDRLSAPRGVVVRRRISAFLASATPAVPRDDEFDE